MWVSNALRGRGTGRTLIEAAVRHAREASRHSARLDTFQARDFYLALGYETFGVLDAYPQGQQRTFMRKALRLREQLAARQLASSGPADYTL